MFQLKSLISNFQQKPLKVIASNNFVSKMNEINDVRKVAVKTSEDTEEKYKAAYTEAVVLLKMFSSKPYFDKNLFVETAELFVEATKIKRDRAEPYFYLSWLFLYAGEVQDSLKYMKIAYALNPFLDGLDELKEQISINAKNEAKSGNIYHTPEKIESEKQQQKPQISRIQPVAVKKLNPYQRYF